MSEKIQLTGNNAFYNLPDYEAVTRAELAKPTTLSKCHYRYETESKVWRVVKIIFGILLPLVGLYWGLHALAGKCAIPAYQQRPTSLCEAISNFTYDQARSRAMSLRCRNYLAENLTFSQGSDSWKVKRLTIEVNGTPIDAMIVGKPSTFGNGRWTLQSLGMTGFYEGMLLPATPKKPETTSTLGEMLTALDSNAVVFNYPGLGANQGFRERSMVINAYKAMLNMLEDQKEGLGAKEIILHGYSLGTVVQGEALNTHELKKGIRYVAVKDRPPADLSSAASGVACRCFGGMVKLLNWNLSSVASSKKLKCPEIILQTATRVRNGRNYRLLTKPEEVIDDEVITKEASLAKQLLDDPQTRRPNQRILGMYEMHGDRILDWKSLGTIIKADLAAQA